MTKAIISRALLSLLVSASIATPALAGGFRHGYGGYGYGYGGYARGYYGHGHSRGGSVAAGLIGGVIIGALIASANNKAERERTVVVQQPGYAPPQPTVVYAPPVSYSAPAPYYAPASYNAPVEYVRVAQPAYVQSYGFDQCYERTVTEATVSGRIVTYTDRVC